VPPGEGGEGDLYMAEVKVGKGESLDRALRRFRQSLRKAGVLSELKKRSHYEKPSVRRKKKADEARKRKR
jgi:ribosomal protein S21